MYKNRISQWGFLKNNKRQEKGNKSHKAVKRDVASLKSQTTRKQQTQFLDPEELRTAGLEVSEDHQLLAYLTSPDTLHFREDFLSGLGDLFKRYYTLDPNFNRGVVPFLSHVVSGSRRMVNCLIQASWFFEQNEAEYGVKFAMKAFNGLLGFLDDQNFYSLIYLFISIPRWQDSGLLAKLLRYLAEGSKTRFGPNHRFSVLFNRMSSFYNSHGAIELASAVTDSLKGIFEMIEDMGNKDDYCLTWLKCDYVWICDLGRPWVECLLKEVRFLNDSLQGRSNVEDYSAWVHTMYMRLQIIRNLEGDHSKITLDAAEDIMRKIRATDLEVQALCFRTMARYHRNLCTMEHPPSDPRHALARHCLKRATVYDEKYWGLGRKVVIQDLKQLEAWNTEAQCWHEAQVVNAKVIQGLQTISEGSV